MRWKFAFGLASADLFFVTTRRSHSDAAGATVRSKVTSFHDEDEFLGHLIRAGLREDQTTRLARAVLLSVAKPVSPPPWTEVDVTQRQMELLHVAGSALGGEDGELPHGKDLYLQAARAGSLPQFYDLLMQAPTAISMVMGPEHRYSFINERYAKLIGARNVAAVLGNCAADRYAGDQRRGISEMLDRVYQTGEVYIGTETLRRYFHEESGAYKEGYFNTVYQPIVNAFGDVAGIMVQSTDVTEMVLERDVREQRERQLYRQWAELEAIYANAAMALLVVDARDYRILRLNESQAKILGGSVAKLTGQPLMGYLRYPSMAREIFAMVVKEKTVCTQMVERESLASPGVMRRWLSGFSPVFSAGGDVEAITVIAIEIPRDTPAVIEDDSAASRELAVMV